MAGLWFGTSSLCSSKVSCRFRASFASRSACALYGSVLEFALLIIGGVVNSLIIFTRAVSRS